MIQVIETVKSSLNGNRKLRITKYRNSKGEVKDLEVEFVGAIGYRDMVRQSLAQAMNVPMPAGVDAASWETARNEQIDSWTHTVQGHEPSAEMGFGYSTPMDRPGAIKLEYLKRLGEVGELTDLPKSQGAIAKKHLQHMLPVGRFMGSVILEAGKFERIDLIEDAPIAPAAPVKLPLTDYQSAVLVWEAPSAPIIARFDERWLRLVHSVLGLVSEIAELIDSDSKVNAIGETGDAFWFIGCGLKGLGMNFQPLGFYVQMANALPPMTEGEIKTKLTALCASFADHIKGGLFYDKKEFPSIADKTVKVVTSQQLALDLMQITTLYVRYCQVGLQLDPELVLAANYAKLLARNKNKATFNQAAVLNRDTVNEDKMLAHAAGV